MKSIKLISLLFLIIEINFISSITKIELKKSLANYHTEYLLNLKFQQIQMFESSLLEKDNDSALYKTKFSFLSKNSLNDLDSSNLNNKDNSLSEKFLKKYSKQFSSFLEERDISLHQQVLAQKRLATYYGDINVGYGRDGDPSKSQSFKMLFDTGSCEFWIPSDDCTTSRCLSHTRYSRSQSFNPYKNSKMAIQYLSGKVEGMMATESIGLGDLIINNQVIGVAKEVEIPLLDEVIWDGILGLAYPNRNLRKQNIKPLFDNLISQDLLKKRGEQNQFSYYLGHENGSITFGGADMRFKKDVNEEFKWAPISEKNYWTISLLDIKKYKPSQVIN